MAIVHLPNTAAFAAARLSLSVQTSTSGFTGFFTGNRQRRGHLADRLRMTLTLPPCKAAAAAEREAFVLGVLSAGHHIRCGMQQRQQARGTVRGNVTVAASVAAGARSIAIAGASAGATLLAGDWLGIGGNLLQVSNGGAVMDNGGAGVVPLALPVQRAIASGQAVAVVAPTGLWELDDAGLQLDYSAPSMQAGIALPLLQVVL